MSHMIPCWLLLTATVVSAAERPADFAYGARLEADGKEALYEVALPAMVYRGVAQPDLRDVRVFNGGGEVVPHAWRARRTEGTEAAPPVALTLFPLKAEPGTTVDGLAISVRRSAGGATTINVTSSGAGGTAEKRTVGYLVDLTGFERALRAIELDWMPAADGFAGKLRVDGSDDLGVWRALVTAAPLVNLEVAGQRLQQKRIELPQQKVKYLRLAWVLQGRTAPPDLTSASGELVDKTIEAPREWAPVESGKGERPGEFVFDVRGHFPVDRIRLHLPEPNTVVQVELLARNRSDQPWRQVARGVAYRLRRGEGEVTSPDLAVGVATDRYWLLRVDQRGGGLGAGAPKLETGWVPHQLVFAARGSPPFQLAYGKRDAKPAAHAIETLIPGYREETGARIRAAKAEAQQTVNVQGAQALVQTELGGESRRQEAVDWKRWSLWAALVLGVLILGAMAWRLMRQLDSGGKTPPVDDAPKRE
jgi:hypothetical protein